MCGEYNVRAFAEDNTGQNTGKGHTSNPRTEIKIPDPAGFEGRDSTDHATATDMTIDSQSTKIVIIELCTTCFIDSRGFRHPESVY